MHIVLAVMLLVSATPALGQGMSIPGLGGQGGGRAAEALRGAFEHQTPEQRRAFCGRVGQAALRCGTIDMAALSACLVRSLPPQDSARVARVAQARVDTSHRRSSWKTDSASRTSSSS